MHKLLHIKPNGLLLLWKRVLLFIFHKIAQNMIIVTELWQLMKCKQRESSIQLLVMDTMSKKSGSQSSEVY